MILLDVNPAANVAAPPSREILQELSSLSIMCLYRHRRLRDVATVQSTTIYDEDTGELK